MSLERPKDGADDEREQKKEEVKYNLPFSDQFGLSSGSDLRDRTFRDYGGPDELRELFERRRTISGNLDDKETLSSQMKDHGEHVEGRRMKDHGEHVEGWRMKDHGEHVEGRRMKDHGEHTEVVEVKPAAEICEELLTELFGSQDLDKIKEAAEVIASELRATGESLELSRERAERMASYLRDNFIGGHGNRQVDEPTSPMPVSPSGINRKSNLAETMNELTSSS